MPTLASLSVDTDAEQPAAVEVVRPDSSVAARGLVLPSDAFAEELKPGPYVVVVRLPSGEEHVEQVVLDAAEPTTIQLSPDPSSSGTEPPPSLGGEAEQEQRAGPDRPASLLPGTAGPTFTPGGGKKGPFAHADALLPIPSAWPDAPAQDRHSDKATKERRSARSGRPGEGALGWTLRAFAHDPLVGGGGRPAPAPRVEPAATSGLLELHLPDQTRIVQLLRPGAAPVCAVVPLDKRFGALVIDADDSGRPAFAYRLRHTLADAALISTAQNKLLDARSYARVMEEALQQKMNDPLAAAAAAYTLLMLGDLDRLHDWTANLFEQFEWLPDGAAIWAEHAARLGRHEEALVALQALFGRGLPVFSEGLVFAVERLRLYTRTTARPDGSTSWAAQALARVDPFVQHADLSRPTLTYTARAPHRPSRRPVWKSEMARLRGLHI